MESTCQPGMIQVSDPTYMLLPKSEVLHPTGGIEIKGKGMMRTHVWQPPPGFFDPAAKPMLPPKILNCIVTTAVSGAAVATPASGSRGRGRSDVTGPAAVVTSNLGKWLQLPSPPPLLLAPVGSMAIMPADLEGDLCCAKKG